MNIAEITAWVGLPLLVMGSIIGYLRWRGDVIFVNPVILTSLQNQNLNLLEKNRDLSDRLDEEIASRRQLKERIDAMERRFLITDDSYAKLKSDYERLSEESKKLKEDLEEANLKIELLLEYIDDQGLDKPDIKFRG